MTQDRRGTIDAHLHLWNRSRSDYAWITPEAGPLFADFDGPAAQAELDQNGVKSAILVQADDSVDDTSFMLEVAHEQNWVAAVVGWVTLEDPREAEVTLSRWLPEPKFRGVRQLLHNDPRPLLAQKEALDILRMLAAERLTFDVPNAWPRLLPQAIAAADAIPELTIVIDHLGKPSNDEDAFRSWRDMINDAARRPNVIAKLSGLHELSPEMRARVWDAALDAFGATGIAYGSDWPMSIASGGYRGTWNSTLTLIESLSPFERGAVLSGTARSAYRLADY